MKKEAEALVDFVDSKIKENNESNLKILSTKEDFFHSDKTLPALKESLRQRLKQQKTIC